jgi:hypothetical protein
MASTGRTIWESQADASIVARIALAGDFLPAGRLGFAPDETWKDKALLLSSAFNDIAATFVNCECTIDSDGLIARTLNGIGEIVAAPAQSLEYLRALNSPAAGIANNHIFDFGSVGAERTRDAIRAGGITPLGFCRGTENPPDVGVWDGPAGLRVGLWAAAQATWDPASLTKPGVEPATLDRGEQALSELKARGANFRVALVHAGCLRTNRPDPEDVRLMDSLAKAGFDIVAASHSHRISGHRRMDGSANGARFCFYGLGSLVSGYAASAPEKEGLVVVAGFNGSAELASVEVRPLLLDSSGFGTVPATGAADTLLQRFADLSAEIENGDYRRLFYHEVSYGLGKLYLRDAREAYRAAGLSGLAKKARRVRMRHVRRLVHKFVG